jgi:hypothetical protein
MSEYEIAQKAFSKNRERLRAEWLAREAALAHVPTPTRQDRHAAPLSSQPALGPPDDRDARTKSPHSPSTRRRPKHPNIRHAHGTFDKEHAERLIVDRPAPEFRPADADDRDSVVTLTSELASFDTWPERNRKAPTTPNLIAPLPAAGLKTYLSSVSSAFSAERQPRVVGEGDFQPRRFTGRYDLVEKDGRVEAERPCGAATRSARLPLYAADRADRLLRLRRGLTAGEARKKRHRNDDQPTQHGGLPVRINDLLKKAQQIDTATQIHEWLDS